MRGVCVCVQVATSSSSIISSFFYFYFIFSLDRREGRGGCRCLGEVDCVICFLGEFSWPRVCIFCFIIFVKW